MSGYLGINTLRGDRYAREERYRKTSKVAGDEDVKGLRQLKREVNNKMNDHISKTLSDLLHHTNPESAEKICKRLEKDVYRKFPTPVNRLRMAVDYISASGVDVSTPLWAIQLGTLKVKLDQATDPNQFYKLGVD